MLWGEVFFRIYHWNLPTESHWKPLSETTDNGLWQEQHQPTSQILERLGLEGRPQRLCSSNSLPQTGLPTTKSDTGAGCPRLHPTWPWALQGMGHPHLLRAAPHHPNGPKFWCNRANPPFLLSCLCYVSDWHVNTEHMVLTGNMQAYPHQSFRFEGRKLKLTNYNGDNLCF